MSGSTSPRPIDIVLVDDHTIFRATLRRVLEGHGHRVVGEASNGEEAVGLALRFRSAVVVMDVSMPVMDGIEATRSIVEADSRIKVLVLTMHSAKRVLEDALRVGARGYCTKTSALDELMALIGRVHAGDVAISSDMTTPDVSPDGALRRVGPLSERETEVLELVARGLDNVEIAEVLFISARTVKNHLAAIYAKLDVDDKTKALVKALRLGLVEIE
jgi:DNA-binding NarL/FixJ family response regulator